MTPVSSPICSGVPEDEEDPFRPVFSSDSVSRTFAHEPWRGGEFILRVQPELLRGETTMSHSVRNRSWDSRWKGTAWGRSRACSGPLVTEAAPASRNRHLRAARHTRAGGFRGTRARREGDLARRQGRLDPRSGSGRQRVLCAPRQPACQRRPACRTGRHDRLRREPRATPARPHRICTSDSTAGGRSTPCPF